MVSTAMFCRRAFLAAIDACLVNPELLDLRGLELFTSASSVVSTR
jgi:hypothetical protein